MLARTHQNVVVVALANKLVRMSWAVLCKDERYRAPVFAGDSLKSLFKEKEFLIGSIKGKVKKNTSPSAGNCLTFQPL
jgi:hypothetical protein